MKLKMQTIVGLMIWAILTLSCKDDPEDVVPIDETPDTSIFYFGADLSYVNQILDHGGVYKDGGVIQSPYKIFKDHGSNLVRLRLWHNPIWTQQVYGAAGTQLYNDLADVAKSIALSKEQGLSVLLDLHYSDTWADPGKQEIPATWREIKDINVLKDSVYNYTFKVFQYLIGKNLAPELVQIGNETNCGMLYTNAPAGFPACNVCNGEWQRMGIVVNSAIKAVKDATASTSVNTKVLLHVADPKNVEWWFDNMTDATKGNVKDFDMIGFSYYPIWHTTVSLDLISDNVSKFKTKYGKSVMILETAYPWTTGFDDNYSNQFGSQAAINGYPYTIQGQHDLMVKITQEVKDGGGQGVIYWEPAWISSDMKDLWGTGSSWENNTFFDFDGNTIQGIDFMKHDFK
ncbi:glycosyl hydrolase 53 family protein [Chryseolinea sp. H1M3-3]|uniref:glycoside hydrolase family 53 protein n=1 Tax=Chryseolinea sp. H1M3-3 TaxID=3034144 RepID=UPI0023EDDA1D|nr:glycosyl hydrolase 53 family protein [Chryseolinea sp. H1M3-3]